MLKNATKIRKIDIKDRQRSSLNKDKDKNKDKNKIKDNIYAQNREQFSAFWSAYPKKKGKQDAEKAFSKLKPDEELLNKILTTLEEQKKTEEWQKADGQFIPYPATYLNGKRWEDEITVVTEPELEYWGDVYG